MKCAESVNKRLLTTHSKNYLAVGLVGGGVGVGVAFVSSVY